MDRLSWELHQLWQEIRRLQQPGGSNATTTNAAYATSPSSSSMASIALHHELRRVMRRLDKTLLSLEQLQQSQSDQMNTGEDGEDPSELSQSLQTNLTNIFTNLQSSNDEAKDLVASILQTTTRLVLTVEHFRLDHQATEMLLRKIAESHMPDSLLTDAWLKVLNHSWMSGARPHIDLPQILLWLYQLLPEAVSSLQQTQWDIANAQAQKTETQVQRRILVGFLLEQVAAALASNTTTDSIRASFQQYIQPWNANAPAVQESLSGMIRQYASDLVDYALDSLDGVAVIVIDDQTGDGMTLWALQDCLRHVTLATNTLVAIEHFKLMDCSALLKTLWKAMATSFCESREVNSESEMDLCGALLRLADLVLPSLKETIESETPALTLTFLRALKFPDMLMASTTVLSTIDEQVALNAEVKHTVQAAVLSLQWDPNTRADKHALGSRFLRMLSDEKSNAASMDVWDAFFTRKLSQLNA